MSVDGENWARKVSVVSSEKTEEGRCEKDECHQRREK
jgi:hypothetical protein